MTANLSPTFLADLAQVYVALRTHALSPAFQSDLEKVYAKLPVASDATLSFLAERFHDWQRVTREFVRTRLAELSEDDPLLCPISLFRTMDSGRLEVAHTRTLAWLLDPGKNEEHGFGDALLAALLGRLADRAHFDRLQVKRVAGEHSVDGREEKGRLDVLAEGEWECAGEHVSWMLVIEAKIDAWEGDGQLEKYDEWLLAHAAGREIYRVFLTPDGRPPESGGDEWTAISFPHLVQIFRQVYLNLKTSPGFHFLRFYLAGVLQDICGWPRKVTNHAISDLDISAAVAAMGSGGTVDLTIVAGQGVGGAVRAVPVTFTAAEINMLHGLSGEAREAAVRTLTTAKTQNGDSGSFRILFRRRGVTAGCRRGCGGAVWDGSEK